MAETEEEPINLLQDFHQSSKQKRALRRRQGFALGMAVLVCAVPYTKVDVLLKLTVELLEISSSMKGKLILEWIADKNIPYSKELVGSRLFGNTDTEGHGFKFWNQSLVEMQEITQLFKASQYFLRELSERVKHGDVRTVEVIVALQKHSKGKFDYITRKKISLASEIGSIEDKDSVGAVGTSEIFKGWVIESLSKA
ncbi:hypothetical protein H5410_010563 [Solanum commersonii]|uniref:Uncharacterized protein n=1 Tax=Solanum commersonii TaxID=4109 RepID=A0A9J6ALT3_SOLCO|nr:hypothetical protein H5410_010563 [Solanum commersonii]